MRVVIYGFLIFFGIVLLILPVAVPVIKTTAEFSMFNTKWNGCSKFAKLLKEKGKVVPILYSYNSIELKKLDGVLVVIGPSVEFSEPEAKEVKEFLKHGGTVFVADDFGTANTLLEKLGVKARFSRKKLKNLFYIKNENFPLLVRINNPILAQNVSKVILNVPSTITGIKKDACGCRVFGSCVLAELEYEKGKIILLSDPSILINEMFDENKNFIKNLIQSFNFALFYYDEAHHLDFNPYSVTTVYIHKELDKEKASFVFLSVVILAIFIESGAALKLVNVVAGVLAKVLPKREEILFDSLPEWVDKKLLKNMLREIENGSKVGVEDEWKRIFRKIEKGV